MLRRRMRGYGGGGDDIIVNEAEGGQQLSAAWLWVITHCSEGEVNRILNQRPSFLNLPIAFRKYNLHANETRIPQKLNCLVTLTDRLMMLQECSQTNAPYG